MTMTRAIAFASLAAAICGAVPPAAFAAAMPPLSPSLPAASGETPPPVPAAAAADARWYVVIDGQAVGPLTDEAVLRRMDHANIFLIIAGTNTPVLFALSPAIRRPYLTVIWTTTAIGTILHIVWLRTPNWVFTTVYVVLGLAPVTLIPQLWTAPAVGPAPTVLIACGGAAYIAGAVCFALRKPNPVPGWFEFHEVFHLGTVIGYACHVVAIYLIVCAL